MMRFITYSVIIAPMPRKKTTEDAPVALQALDTRYLEGLLGYNARRAALAIIEVFLQRMQVYELRPVDFSVLSVIAHNPGVTSRQLCAALVILPPNFVNMLASLEKRALVERQPHPSDKRAVALQLTVKGSQLMRKAEQTAQQLEGEAAARLSATERKTLIRLLQKIYLQPTPN
jgi:DNA-binding MarR family transcriptional regulator